MTKGRRRLRLDLRWFIFAACILTPFSIVRLETVQQQQQQQLWFDYDNATTSADVIIDAPAIDARHRNSTTTGLHVVTSSSSAVSSTTPLKFYILDVPELTTWLTGNHTEKASTYYSKALNEESAEIWLHRGFERMTYEQGHVTLNPNEADVFIIPGYLHLNLAIQNQQQQNQEEKQIGNNKKKYTH